MKKTFKIRLHRLFALILTVIFGLNCFVQNPSDLHAVIEGVSPASLSAASSLAHLPSELGQVKELHLSANTDAPFYIHIQDAHANPDAQQKIKEILTWFLNQTGEKNLVIGLEATSGEIHPEYAAVSKRFLKLNEAVVLDLHVKGELTGAELLAWELFKKQDWTRYSAILQGIEDADLFRVNLGTYRKLIADSSSIQKELEPVRKNLELAKSKHLSKDVQRFFKERERRRNGKFGSDFEGTPQISSYLQYLTAELKEKIQIDLTDPVEQLRTPNLTRILALEKLTKIVNLETAEQQQEKWNHEVTAKARSAADKAFSASLETLDVSTDPRTIAENIFDFASRYRIDLKKAYPEFVRKLGVLILQSEINAGDLFRELDEMETKLLNVMMKTENEKQTVALQRDFDSLQALLALKLTRVEHSELSRRFHEIRPEVLSSRLTQLLGKNDDQPVRLPAFDEAVQFYDSAIKRDRALLKNLDSLDVESKTRIVVAGGFHSEGFVGLLHSQGAGYAVIQPKITKLADKGLSEKVFLDEHSDLKSYFEKHSFTAQEALFFKQITETAGRELGADQSLTHGQRKAEIAQMLQNHPLLKGSVSISKNTSEGSSYKYDLVDGPKAVSAVGKTLAFSNSQMFSVLHPGAKRQESRRVNEADLLSEADATRAEELLSVDFLTDLNQLAGTSYIEIGDLLSDMREITGDSWDLTRFYEAVRVPDDRDELLLDFSNLLRAESRNAPLLNNIQQWHLHFDSLARMAKDSPKAEQVQIDINVKSDQGSITESIALPLRDAVSEKDNAAFYAAMLIANRGIFRGAEEVWITVANGGKSLNDDSFMRSVWRNLQIHFGKTEYFSSYGKGILFPTFQPNLWDRILVFAIKGWNDFVRAAQAFLTKSEQNFSAQHVGSWLYLDSSNPYRQVAEQVYTRIGKNLALQYLEVQRILSQEKETFPNGIPQISGILTGGIVTGKSGEVILGALLKEAQRMNLNLTARIVKENQFAGARGAAWLGFKKQLELNKTWLRILEGAGASQNWIQNFRLRAEGISNQYSLGIDLGGSSAKIAVLNSSGQTVYEEIMKYQDGLSIAAAIHSKVYTISKIFDFRFNETPIYVSVPGPVDESGAIVDMVNLEKSRPGTLVDLNQMGTIFTYVNDADAALFSEIVAENLTEGLVVANTLGTGLGFTMAKDGQLLSGPKEAHFMAFTDNEAEYHTGFGMRGDMESYASHFAVLNFAQTLLEERGLRKLPKAPQVAAAAPDNNSLPLTSWVRLQVIGTERSVPSYDGAWHELPVDYNMGWFVEGSPELETRKNEIFSSDPYDQWQPTYNVTFEIQERISLVEGKRPESRYVHWIKSYILGFALLFPAGIEALSQEPPVAAAEALSAASKKTYLEDLKNADLNKKMAAAYQLRNTVDKEVEAGLLAALKESKDTKLTGMILYALSPHIKSGPVAKAYADHARQPNPAVQRLSIRIIGTAVPIYTADSPDFKKSAGAMINTLKAGEKDASVLKVADEALIRMDSLDAAKKDLAAMDATFAGFVKESAPAAPEKVDIPKDPGKPAKVFTADQENKAREAKNQAQTFRLNDAVSKYTSAFQTPDAYSDIVFAKPIGNIKKNIENRKIVMQVAKQLADEGKLDVKRGPLTQEEISVISDAVGSLNLATLATVMGTDPRQLKAAGVTQASLKSKNLLLGESIQNEYVRYLLKAALVAPPELKELYEKSKTFQEFLNQPLFFDRNVVSPNMPRADEEKFGKIIYAVAMLKGVDKTHIVQPVNEGYATGLVLFFIQRELKEEKRVTILDLIQYWALVNAVNALSDDRAGDSILLVLENPKTFSVKDVKVLTDILAEQRIPRTKHKELLVYEILDNKPVRAILNALPETQAQADAEQADPAARQKNYFFRKLVLAKNTDEFKLALKDAGIEPAFLEFHQKMLHGHEGLQKFFDAIKDIDEKNLVKMRQVIISKGTQLINAGDTSHRRGEIEAWLKLHSRKVATASNPQELAAANQELATQIDRLQDAALKDFVSYNPGIIHNGVDYYRVILGYLLYDNPYFVGEITGENLQYIPFIAEIFNSLTKDEQDRLVKILKALQKDPGAHIGVEKPQAAFEKVFSEVKKLFDGEYNPKGGKRSENRSAGSAAAVKTAPKVAFSVTLYRDLLDTYLNQEEEIPAAFAIEKKIAQHPLHMVLPLGNSIKAGDFLYRPSTKSEPVFWKVTQVDSKQGITVMPISRGLRAVSPAQTLSAAAFKSQNFQLLGYRKGEFREEVKKWFQTQIIKPVLFHNTGLVPQTAFDLLYFEVRRIPSDEQNQAGFVVNMKADRFQGEEGTALELPQTYTKDKDPIAHALLSTLIAGLSEEQLEEMNIVKVGKNHAFGPRLGELYAAIHSRSEMRAPQAIVDRGIRYFNGEIKTEPVKARYRPSRKGDFKEIPSLSAEERLRYMRIALESLRKGEGVFSTAAAGAAARMSMKELQKPENKEKYADLLQMAEEVFQGDHDILSKAAVPIGRDRSGKPYTFLGLMMTNISRLEQQISEAFGGEAQKNRVLIMTNEAYQEELEKELGLNGHYGIDPEQFMQYNGRLGFQQELGFKYYANPKDTAGVFDKLIAEAKKENKADIEKELIARKERAVAKAKEIEARINAGEPDAVIYETEKDPLGHGEFDHQRISTGLLLDLIGDDFDNPKTRWISFRNIDNAAATFDDDWLVSLGLFLEQGLDMQPEVSLRMKGQRGGGLIVTEDANHQLTEDPSFAATFKAVVDELEKAGMARIGVDEKGKLTEDFKNALRDKINRGETISLEATRMMIDAEEITDLNTLNGLLSQADDRILAFRDPSGIEHYYRIVTSADTYGFNDAVALESPMYLLDLYRKPGQSRREVYEEMKAARAAGTLEEIAERGRNKFPSLVDPKPAKDNPDAVTVKIETNKWQGTGVVGTDTKIRTVGVYGLGNLDMTAYDQADDAQKAVMMGNIRMLATKSWEGPVESYESNQKFIAPIILSVTEGQLFPAEAVRTEMRSDTLPILDPGITSRLESYTRLLDSNFPADVRTGIQGILSLSKENEVIKPSIAAWLEHYRNHKATGDIHKSQITEAINYTQGQTVGFIGGGGLTFQSILGQSHQITALASDKNAELTALLRDQQVYRFKKYRDLGTYNEINKSKISREDMVPIIKNNNVIVLDIPLLPGTKIENYTQELISLSMEIGHALKTARDQGDNQRKVFVLTAYAGVHFSQVIYEKIQYHAEPAPGENLNFDVVYKPDLSLQSSAADPIMEEPYTVFGLREKLSADERASTQNILSSLYTTDRLEKIDIEFMNIRSAEQGKDGLLIWLATKYLLFNETATISGKVGADMNVVALGAGLDRRIRTLSVNPSMGFGGRLLGLIEWIKEVRLHNMRHIPNAREAVEKQAKDYINAIHRPDYLENPEKYFDLPGLFKDPNFSKELHLLFWLEVILQMNKKTRERFQNRILRRTGKLLDKSVTLVGVGYNRHIGQVTESPALDLIRWLVLEQRVGKIVISDPEAEASFKEWLKTQKDLPIEKFDFEPSLYDAIKRSPYTILATDSNQELLGLDRNKFFEASKGRGIFDAVNLFGLSASGKTRYTIKDFVHGDYYYMGIGRPEGVKDSTVYTSANYPVKSFNQINVVMVGGGYVGLVTAAHFASLGHKVHVIETVQSRVDGLNQADTVLPIYEPGLKKMIDQGKQDGLITFGNADTYDSSIRASDLIYVAVGTPSTDTGGIDTTALVSATKQIGRAIAASGDRKGIVIKSTITPETYTLINKTLSEVGVKLGEGADLAGNPEFLKEGTAIKDTKEPDRIELGAYDGSESIIPKLLELYYPMTVQNPKLPVVVTDSSSAALTKYAANGMLAVSVSLTNLIARDSELQGAEYDEVMKILRKDSRIGSFAFLAPGCGYGGSCFPKDSKALTFSSSQLTGTPVSTVLTAHLLNDYFQTDSVQDAIALTDDYPFAPNSYNGKTIANVGLTFKPDTDDMRESPAIAQLKAQLDLKAAKVIINSPIFTIPDAPAREVLMNNFYAAMHELYEEDLFFAPILAAGLKQKETESQTPLSAADKKAFVVKLFRQTFEKAFGDRLIFTEDLVAGINAQDGKVEIINIATDWPQYKQIDFSKLKLAPAFVVYDSRGVLTPDQVDQIVALGGTYKKVGSAPKRSENRSELAVENSGVTLLNNLNDLSSSAALRQRIETYPAQKAAGLVSPSQLSAGRFAAENHWNFEDIAPSVSAETFGAIAKLALMPEAHAAEDQSLIAVGKQAIGETWRQTLFNQQAGAEPIHVFVPVHNIKSDLDLPESTAMFLEESSDADKITLLISGEFTTDDLQRMKNAFLSRYGLTAKAPQLALMSVKPGTESQSLINAVNLESDRIPAILSDSQQLLEGLSTEKKRFTARISATGKTRAAVQLLWTADQGINTGIMVSGLALRQQLSDSYSVRNIKNELQSRYDLADLNARISQMVQNIRHIATQA